MIGIATLIILTYLTLLRIANPESHRKLRTGRRRRAKQSRFVMAASGAILRRSDRAVPHRLRPATHVLHPSSGFKIGNKVGTEWLEHMEYTHSQPWTGIGSALQVIAYLAAILTVWLLLVAIRSANSLGKLR